MSEKDLTDTESENHGYDVEPGPDRKSLPWHSTDLVKRNKASSDDDSSGLSEDEAICSNDKDSHKAVSDHSIPLYELDMVKMNLNPDDKSPERNYISKSVLPWNDAPGNIEMKDPPSEINLLLLGESGVGKSTFINSFANYMKHENFEAVQDNVLSVLIPARFNIFDKEFKKHVIEIGANDDNEHLVDGAAATQDVKTYVFYITLDNRPFLIRLIDTPGMGDTRGIEQDNKNCDYVLNYIGRLQKIHAICLLLKPTNTRLDVFLNYCVTQILSRLEKSATDNIAFLFTNTRGQNYTPGDTYTSLELLVKKIKDTNNVTLPLSHANVFCFDNEAFRFLASIKQGVQFREGVLVANIESWKYSYKEVYRLLSYIVQLKPHDPQKTISINHARKMVMQLSQPLAEIVQLIGDNIYMLDQHTNQLLMENQTLGELKQKLYMPVIDIKAKELDQPVTVCTAPKCSAIYKVGDKNKFHYAQRCHNPCYLNGVPAEIVGDPQILGCWAITRSTQTCHQCGCRFNTHMHIYYETDTFESKIVDQNVQKNINSKEDATREKQVVINNILNRKEELEKEHKYIIKCSAAFAHFLQQNAITPMNDSLKEYVKYLITREENLGADADRANLEYLRRLLSEYKQEKNVLIEALRYNTGGISASSTNAIETKIKELFTLPNFGKKIKELYDLHQGGGVREHKQSEIVVKERYTLRTSIVDTVKSYGSAVMGAFGFGNSKKQHRLEFERQRALAMEKFEREYYGSQMQRQERHPSVQFNEQYSNQYFGPNGRGHYDEFDQYYGWGVEEYRSPSERQDLHRQYALEYRKRDSNRQYVENSYVSEPQNANDFNSRKKYNGDENNTRNGNRRATLNSGMQHFGRLSDRNDNTFSAGQNSNNAPKSETQITSKYVFGNAHKTARTFEISKALGNSQNDNNKDKGPKSVQGNGKKEAKESADSDTGTQVAKIEKNGKKKNKKKNKNKKK